jgi:hypothetical protein
MFQQLLQARLHHLSKILHPPSREEMEQESVTIPALMREGRL